MTCAPLFRTPPSVRTPSRSLTVYDMCIKRTHLVNKTNPLKRACEEACRKIAGQRARTCPCRHASQRPSVVADAPASLNPCGHIFCGRHSRPRWPISATHVMGGQDSHTPCVRGLATMYDPAVQSFCSWQTVETCDVSVYLPSGHAVQARSWVAPPGANTKVPA